MKNILLILLLSFFIQGFSQQAIKISIKQPGIENCLTKNADEIANPRIFEVYPNPTDGNFTIELKGLLSDDFYSISLLNTMGQTLLKQKQSSINGTMLAKIKLSKVPDGIYLLKVESLAFSATKKIQLTGKK